MLRASIILAVTAACGHPGWAMYEATPEQEQQALALIASARTVTGAPLPGGSIALVSTPYGLDGTCGIPPPLHVAGCQYGDMIEVLVMPSVGLGPELRRTALAHELCHLALNTRSEILADECAGKAIAALPLPP